MKGKKTKIIFEQFSVAVTFYMRSKLDIATYFEGFGRDCSNDFWQNISVYTKIHTKPFPKFRKKAY